MYDYRNQISKLTLPNMGIFYFLGNKQVVPSIRRNTNTATSGSSGGIGYTSEDLSSLVTGSLKTFPVTAEPKQLFADGVLKVPTYDYNYSAPNVVFVIGVIAPQQTLINYY